MHCVNVQQRNGRLFAYLIHFFGRLFCVFNTLFRATFVCKVTKLFRLAIMISHNFMCKGYFFWEKPGRFCYPLIIPFEAFLLSVFSIRKPLLRS